jgi:hypothetical protein
MTLRSSKKIFSNVSAVWRSSADVDAAGRPFDAADGTWG